MDAQFWINAWDEGRTGFHQGKYHEKLLEYFPQFNPKQGQNVLVPLCGKSKDLLWLGDQGLNVRGVELYNDPVESFFAENDLSPMAKDKVGIFVNYVYKNLTISCGDFLELKEKDTFDFIYDRASLVALPASMRKEYADVITNALKSGGNYLLIVYEYDQSKLQGPPFSISAAEVHELYEKNFEIQLKESMTPSGEGSKLSSLQNFKQVIYVLKKK